MKNLEIGEDSAIISIDPSIFSLEVIYSAAYVLLDKAYFLFSGDPSKEVRVKMIPKEDCDDLRKVALRFNNELINYSVYAIQASRNKDLRAAIIKRALSTNKVLDTQTKKGQEKQSREESQVDEEFKDIEIEDPKGISEPWTPDKAPEDAMFEEEKDHGV